MDWFYVTFYFCLGPANGQTAWGMEITKSLKIGTNGVGEVKDQLGGGFKHFFYFHPYLGKIPILTNIFQRG